MKTTFNNVADIAHMWANQTQPSANYSGGNFYFEGDTIYSYGSHFPIARHYNGKVLFTLDNYSKTTSKHVSLVDNASSHKEKIYMLHVLTGKVYPSDHEKNIKHFIYKITGNIQKLKSARKKEIYTTNIDHNKKMLEEYVNFFKVKLSKEQKFLIENATPEGYGIYSTKEAARIKRAEAIRQKELAIQHAEELSNWRKFKTQHIRTRSGCDYLRFNKEAARVETSQGIQIPVNVAEKLFRSVVKTVAAGGCNGECKETILHYNIDQITPEFLKVGCHLIYMNEIKSFASKMKW